MRKFQKLIAYTLLIGAMCSTPAKAADSDFTTCDGYNPPTKKTDGMTRSSWLWGLASQADDIRKSDNIPFGTQGLSACDAALQDPRLISEFWLRRAHLLQAKAMHAIGANKAEMALQLVDESDAIISKSGDPDLRYNLGIGNRAVRSYAFISLNRKDDAHAEIKKILEERPWSFSGRQLTRLLKTQLDHSPENLLKDMSNERRMSPELAHPLFWTYFSDGNFASAIDNAPVISFAKPKIKGNWTIDGAEDQALSQITDQADISGAWAYALAARGQKGEANVKITEERSRLEEARIPPAPQSDGTPPKKSTVAAYNTRLPHIDTALSNLQSWEDAIRFREDIVTLEPAKAIEAIEASNFKELPVISDLLTQIPTRFRGQSLTGDSDLDSRLTFGGSLGRADWRDRRGMGSDRAVIAA